MATGSSVWVRSRHRIEHWIYAASRAALGSLPEPLRLRLGTVLGRLAFRIDRRHRRVALENLLLAYPDLDDAERLKIARSCFESFGLLLADVLGSIRLDGSAYSKRFEVEGWHHLEAAEALDRGVLLLTGHLGNWEALAQYLALTGRPVSFVARPLDNPLIERDFRRIRERFGNRSIPKRSAARGVLRVLRAKGRVGILMDQRVHPNEGKAYPFFGQPAYTTSMPARLSIRTGAAAVPIFGLPIDGWRRCRVVIHPPILPEASADGSDRAVDALTHRYLQVIERTIRSSPHLWLWMHRRWRQFPDWETEAITPEAVSKPAEIPKRSTAEVLSKSSRRA